MMFYVYAIMTGVLGGITSGMFGVGGGIILIPMMTLFLKVDMRQAVTASLIVIVPTGLANLVNHLRIAPVEKSIWILAGVMIIGGIIGAFAGANLCHSLPIPVLKKLFACLLFFVAIKMFVS